MPLFSAASGWRSRWVRHTLTLNDGHPEPIEGAADTLSTVGPTPREPRCRSLRFAKPFAASNQLSLFTETTVSV